MTNSKNENLEYISMQLEYYQDLLQDTEPQTRAWACYFKECQYYQHLLDEVKLQKRDNKLTSIYVIIFTIIIYLILTHKYNLIILQIK